MQKLKGNPMSRVQSIEAVNLLERSSYNKKGKRSSMTELRSPVKRGGIQDDGEQNVLAMIEVLSLLNLAGKEARGGDTRAAQKYEKKIMNAMRKITYTSIQGEIYPLVKPLLGSIEELGIMARSRKDGF